MDKKTRIVAIIITLIVIAGIITTFIFGLNFDLIYKQHKEIDIYIGQEFENKDIENIVKEVIGKEKVIIKKVELYEDMVSITVENISDEQLEQLNTKINEKYQLENTKESLLVTDVSNVKGRDLIKPYVWPTIISFFVIEIYLFVYLLIYKKSGRNVKIIKEMLIFFSITVIVQLLYFAIISITRLPINRITIPISILLYLITTIVTLYKLEKQNIKIEKDK
ncbi:MAG: hypothetical protein GX682_00905 [Clostridiaceae bacterium]|nr:hypothetical protein [Clostridiaceae bacterium]